MSRGLFRATVSLDDGHVMPWPRVIGSFRETGVENMEKTGADPVDDRIRFYCASHTTEVPIVTVHERRWAYCPGGYDAAREGHAWTAIEPTHVNQLNPRQMGFARTQGLSPLPTAMRGRTTR